MICTLGESESFIRTYNLQPLFVFVFVCYSACAAVRAFPLFTLKTVNNDISSTVHIEFILIENDSVSDYRLTDNDIECLENAEHAIRLTAKIVDAPCSHMNVTDFINEIEIVGKAVGVVPTIIRGEELNDRGFGGIYGVGRCHS